MKKLFMFMLMAMILSISGWSQETVTFGGTSSTSANTSPLPGYYGYHRSAIVYKPEELADMPSTCNITSIAWRMGGTSNAGGNVSIYLKEIADTAIAGSATWDDVLTDATLVYQGSATAAANTWAEFEFDTPYQYQGGNLVVITQGEGCTTSGGCSKSMYYTGTMGSTTATLSSAWTVYQDSSPQASTVALSGWSTKNHNKYDIKLTYLPADGDYCAGVSGLTKSNVLASTATISWNEREDNATIYVQIKTASQDWEDADEYTTTDNYVDLTDLEPNTEYDVRVMADCGSSQSTYRTTSFRTTCLLISEIPQTWDFENTDHGAGTSSYPLPSCWGRITTSTSSLYPYCYSS
ncbi:MAG: fibronectin type III domain-containing protein, partial [Bacteroidales bacterium]|nr:fibronectin type III domain-containing protein [Bacteroidales bacterium]